MHGSIMYFNNDTDNVLKYLDEILMRRRKTIFERVYIQIMIWKPLITMDSMVVLMKNLYIKFLD